MEIGWNAGLMGWDCYWIGLLDAVTGDGMGLTGYDGINEMTFLLDGIY